MTPEPPASSDGSSLPPRHRPSLDSLSQDTTEKELWALDEDMEGQEGLEKSPTPGAARPHGSEIPAPRERQSQKPRETEKRMTAEASENGDPIRMNVNQRPKRPSLGPAPSPAKPESEFDDLEQWEDVKLEPVVEELPEDGVAEIIEPATGKEADESAAVEEVEETAAPAPVETAGDDRVTAAADVKTEPFSLRPRLELTKIERIGLIVLLLLLVGGGATVFFVSLGRLPVESVKAESQDFPIKGAHVTIASAVSYWRAPIREGPDADTFRRGTELLPVVELAVNGGPAAIRVLFRSEDNTVVGDAVTRAIHGKEFLKIPATAGFDDPGMHAAYRTGESKPWTIEVYEARTASALGKEFTKLFEMNISTDRR